ncbi:MAG: methyltransferase domain-containing protein [Candidatus Kapaibacterium sp.]
MAKDLTEIIKETAISENDQYYWGYQYQLGRSSIAPYLINEGAFKPGYAVCEIGSAEGGVLHALQQEGAVNALGTDIAAFRLETGKKIAGLCGLDTKYDEHNIITEEPKEEWLEAYNLVLLRDVIEHLDDTYAALDNIKKIIRPGGYLYVTFPPYYSPFGGHQHTVANTWGKIPFIHMLPDSIFLKLIESGRPQDIGEVKRLQQIRLTPKKFIEAANKAGYEIKKAEYYFLRPVFKMKFGLPTVKSTPLSFIPPVRDLLSLEASFILRKPDTP